MKAKNAKSGDRYRAKLGDRIMVREYHYANLDSPDERVIALPGETGVIVDNCWSGLVVLFDRTGEEGVVSMDSFDDASDKVQVRPL